MIFSQKKKSNKYKMINAILKMNRVIVRNVNLFFAIDEFVENFVKCAVVFFIDFFIDYNQIEFDKICRDLTTFMTFIELLKMTILFQKIINFVAQFVRIIIRIFCDYIFDKAKFFFDDIEIKKLKTIYNDEKIIFDICKYMTKHIR